VYDSTAVPECVNPDGDDRNGFVVGSGDYRAVVNLIRQLEDGTVPWPGEQIGTGGIRRLSQNKEFVKEESCRKYYELYQRIMGQKIK
jgi:glycosyltransferase involved in cell wall biosynthesis